MLSTKLLTVQAKQRQILDEATDSRREREAPVQTDCTVAGENRGNWGEQRKQVGCGEMEKHRADEWE